MFLKTVLFTVPPIHCDLIVGETPRHMHNTHAHIHTYMHTHIHSCVSMLSVPCVMVAVVPHIHMYTHTHIHTYIHTCTHTYIHAHIHTHIVVSHALCNGGRGTWGHTGVLVCLV